MIRGESEAVILVWTTLPVGRDPGVVAGTLVREGLAACVTVHPQLRSIYRWEGRVEDEAEHGLTIKTTRSRVRDLERRLQELHPYDVPEFLVSSPLEGSEAYLDWVRSSTSTTEPSG